MKKSKLAIFASGAGTNAEAVMKHFQNHPDIEVVMLLSNNPAAPALERAMKFNVQAKSFTREQFRDSDEVIHWLKEAGVTHIVLAGFLWLVPTSLIRAFPERIINIHPSLLPKFSGKGMYGMHVHNAVKLSEERETGISIHVVNENYDEGKILFQKACVLDAADTAEDIAKKVHLLEYENFPGIIERWTKEVS